MVHLTTPFSQHAPDAGAEIYFLFPWYMRNFYPSSRSPSFSACAHDRCIGICG